MYGPGVASVATAGRTGVSSERIAPAAPSRAPGVLEPWVRAQAINAARHAAALRPFRQDEFGTGASAPSDGHIQAANELIGALRNELLKMTKRVSEAAETATGAPVPARLLQLVAHKERAHRWVQAIERIWDFYLELFGQRQSRYADWLLGCDRIALDCYKVMYMGLGVAKSIPAPPPFSYMRTGFSPATFRRGVPLQRLGRQLNPFPLVQLPYHRLVNPWTLGAVLHEVSHNLQSDVGLSTAVPRTIARRLLRAGLPSAVAAIWTRWNRETFADLSGLLLGGPGVVASLLDVVGRSEETAFAFSARGVHPTPYLRALISIDLLRRMGFPDEAEQFRRMWTRMYPNPRAGTIPRVIPGRFGSWEPLPATRAAAFLLLPGFSSVTRTDVGIIHLRDPIGNSIGLWSRAYRRTQIDPYGTSILSGGLPLPAGTLSVNVSGYPADMPPTRSMGCRTPNQKACSYSDLGSATRNRLCGTFQYRAYDRTVRVTSGMLRYLDDTCAGHSGSPVWVRRHPTMGGRVLVGVHTGFRSGANTAVLITPEVLRFIVANTR